MIDNSHLAAGVVLLVPLGRHLHHVPLSRDVEISEVHRHADAVVGRQLIHVTQIQLEARGNLNDNYRNMVTHHEPVIGPASKLHHTLLLVEGEELDVNAAVRLVDGWGVPLDPAVPVEDSLSHDRHLVVSVSAENGNLELKRFPLNQPKRDSGSSVSG